MRKRQILTSLSLTAFMATGWAWAQGGPPAGNAPTTPPQVEAPNAYVIGALDVIYVKVFRNMDFTRAYVVRPDGKIVLPLMGPIEAAGQTTPKLEARIREALSAYVDKPHVSVFIQQVGARPTPP